MIKRKKKICSSCNRETYLFSKGMCRVCWGVSYQKKIKPIAKKRKAELKEYSKLRSVFLSKRKFCEAQLGGCMRIATEVHHKQGRENKMLIDEGKWMAVCRSCHNEIENGGEWVYEKGFKISRI